MNDHVVSERQERVAPFRPQDFTGPGSGPLLGLVIFPAICFQEITLTP